MNQHALIIAQVIVEVLRGTSPEKFNSFVDEAIVASHKYGVSQNELRKAVLQVLKKEDQELVVRLVTPTGDAGEAAVSLRESLSKELQIPIDIHQQAAPILGGAVLSIQDNRIDYSLTSALANLERTLASTTPLAL